MRNFSIILAFLTIIKFSHGNLSLQCIVAYLKSHNSFEEIFSSVEEFEGTEAECESFIRIKIDDFNGKIIEKMEEDSNVKNLIDCFRHEIQSHEYEILTLKLQGVGMINVGWQFWKNGAKNIRYTELQNEIDVYGTKVLEKCAAIDHFGRFFDTTMEKHPSLYQKGENEYCIRRYLIEKSMIDAFAYSFSVNPRNITMENYNCEVIMKEILEPAYENLKKDETPCTWEVAKDSGYYDHLLKTELLTKLSLSAQGKLFERQKFIDAMFNMTQKQRECAN